MGTVAEIAIILLLVLVNGLLALSELAVVSSRKRRLDAMARRGVRGAAAALALAQDPQRFLPTVQVGITLVGVLAGAFGGVGLARTLGTWLESLPHIGAEAHAIAFAIVVAAITLASIVLGEIVPKTLALRRPEPLAATVAPFLVWLAWAAAPAVWLLRSLSGLVLRLFGAHTAPATTVTEEEVKALVAEGAEAGVIEAEERQMIERVLRLPDRPIRAIMTPRMEVGWIDGNDPPPAIAARIRAIAHERLLVCRGGLDDVVGVVRAKELLDAALAGEPLGLDAVIRPAPVLPDHTSVLDAIAILRREPIGLALVVDEYGSFEGIVTAADMLEAIVGEVADEVGQPPAGEVVTREDGSLLMDGMMPVDEVKATLGLHQLPEEGGYHTLAGLILALARRIPAEGDQVVWGGFRFEVVDMDARRIDKVLVRAEPVATPDV
ncbi:hemolysin family protein [Elioraea sp.]|uniref:hemolysin family protein n=1 Tax=Elioraea sp. TaxID=2185103 RepID=UPI003F7277EC